MRGSGEGSIYDKKSLRHVMGQPADWSELAKDCVAFANAKGGVIAIGIEDNSLVPPSGQTIPEELVERVQKRILELTVNVSVSPEIQTAENGGQFIALGILRSPGFASTSKGQYYLRIADDSKPVTGDDLMRLVNERSGRSWEFMKSGTPAPNAAPAEVDDLVRRLRVSERVKQSVKDKTERELLSHYGLTDGEELTNLGALLIGGVPGRRALGTAPIVQAIRYDEDGKKINKWTWDDYEASPLALLDQVWHEIPDFRENYELPDGLFRRNVPAYDKSVVRELLVNALVHRPYTQRGDIFLALHPGRMAITNPGPLPFGVTPRNILHESRRRNDGLARVFHDIELMEREGSGFDLIFERLLGQGRPVPVVTEGPDFVSVEIQRRIIKPEALRILEAADGAYNLSQRERIVLGLLVQNEGMTSRELSKELEVQADGVGPWLGRLLALGLVSQTGRTSATRYFVAPEVLRESSLDKVTTLKRIEPYRLRELVREDLKRYPGSNIAEIHRRIGAEIPRRTLKSSLERLVLEDQVRTEGKVRWTKYFIISV